MKWTTEPTLSSTGDKTMAKKSPEEKAAEDIARDEAKRKKQAAGAKPITIEDAINGLEEQFAEYIKNVGFSVLDAMCREVRKSEKEGTINDKVEGTIVLRITKEGLKLVLSAKSVVTVKDVQKDEYTSLTSDPSNPTLPGMEIPQKDKKKEEGTTEAPVSEVESREITSGGGEPDKGGGDKK